MNKIAKLFAVIAVVAGVGTFSACKKSFDRPPGAEDPAIVANTTIETLKSLHTVSGAYDVITDDIIISGIVTANDKSGNLYKQLFIQDSTGAMQILIDGTNLYGSYPVGRRVFLKCRGLVLSDYRGTMQIGVMANIAGVPSVEGILSINLNKYLLGGSLNNEVVPFLVTPSDLGTNMQNRYINALVQMENFEFLPADTSKPYSDTSAYKSTVNRTIKNCSGGTILVRNSAYSNFAAVKLPKGNGTITSIYTIFKSNPTSVNADKQLLIRDTSDIQFTNPVRCGGITPPTGTTLLFEDFETQVATTAFPYNPINVANWQNLAEVFTRVFDARTFSSNKYAYLSAFGSNAPEVKTWLVTKGVNLNATTGETLTFETKQNFLLTVTPGGQNVASALKVLVSTNYTGTGNPWDASVNWTDVTPTTLSPGSTTSNFPSNYSASTINLSTYSGTVYVAFRYEGADPTGTTNDKTSAWEIDNIRISGN